jgi:hypothetical protein
MSRFPIRRIGWLVGMASVLALTSVVSAQESLDARLQRAEQEYEANRKLTADLQKQNETLLKLLSPAAKPVAGSAAPLGAEEVRDIVSTYLQERDAKQKAADTAATAAGDDRYKIGSNL